MKCAKCGAELKLGCIYCSVCGQEAQIVSESNLLEEELLRELLKEDESKQQSKKQQPKKQQPETIKRKTKKIRNKKAFIGALSCLGVAILVAIILLVVMINRNNNSYDYQMQKAEKNVTEHNYVKALEYYERALELKEDDIVARNKMADVYIAMDEEKKAIILLHEIISLDATAKDAYKKLIELYADNHDYEAILSLQEQITEEDIIELFSEYIVKAPQFSLEPGTYHKYITIDLITEKVNDIYYTVDGSDPLEEGILYKSPIKLEEQDTIKIKMVACNEYGIYSEVVVGNFTVKLKKPDMPVATPDSGNFSEPTTIQLEGPEGCKIYFTWDGTDPTENSALYTGPIDVPEGDNILSVLIVDEYGMISDVLKCNYKYFP